MSRCRSLIQGKGWREPKANLYIVRRQMPFSQADYRASAKSGARRSGDMPVQVLVGSGPIVLNYLTFFLNLPPCAPHVFLSPSSLLLRICGGNSPYPATATGIPFVAVLLIPLLGGSMATRRSHKKSRNGCEQCKRRRVKVCRPSTPPASQYSHLHPVRRGQSMQELQPPGDGVHL